MMVRLACSLFAFASGAALLAAAEPAPPRPGATAQPAKKQRAISDDVAASLSASMPKYNPPKAVEKKAEDAEDVDLREIDKPKNEILRLPQVVVQGQRPGIFRESDLLTRQALARLALQRYRGLSAVPFASLNSKVALQMHQEDERLRNISDLNDAADNAAKAGDSVGSDYIRQQTNETFMRRSSGGWTNRNK